jgi:hypothetical protein
MKFSELENVRVKLDESGRKEFWHRVDEFGGVKTFSDAFSISSSKVYNWKSKDSFIPIKLVKKVFGNEGSTHVEAYKGPGRSNPVKNPVFPIPENSELLTRIGCSVSVNSKGIPLYQASDEGLIERFNHLLQELGSVPVKIYDREVYELRYPKYLHQILMKVSFEQDLDALVDEKADFEGEKIVLNDEVINSAKIGNIYHREKRLKLALIREDNKEIAKLMSEEKEKVRKALNQA